jgi:hypothetical protein
MTILYCRGPESSFRPEKYINDQIIAALNFAFVLVLVLIMLFGPKSAFVQLTIQ